MSRGHAPDVADLFLNPRVHGIPVNQSTSRFWPCAAARARVCSARHRRLRHSASHLRFLPLPSQAPQPDRSLGLCCLLRRSISSPLLITHMHDHDGREETVNNSAMKQNQDATGSFSDCNYHALFHCRWCHWHGAQEMRSPTRWSPLREVSTFFTGDREVALAFGWDRRNPHRKHP
jgi:hypothetical protein